MFIEVKTEEKKFLINVEDISYIEPVASAVFTGVRVFLRTKKPGGDYPMCFEVCCDLDDICDQIEFSNNKIARIR
ncbi:hypothetical protein MTBPR1_20247 [Candidatus Terasakiella magnetica]|uniref:Uncharacterized protein n=1 Tax=Candidatus Terasakiella magnetica TaxID=1867952 RepID=A0A1C3RGL2_9PROT|nr:hypothetical protein [Candidatus Terasakiella magnetica]SCA56399.1 hypothetical protein MTBPR1_20247 [Candidatus Terasakiella magnetica]